MQILFGLSFLILIPIIVGLALILSGNGVGVWILSLGTPSVMILLVITGLILLAKGKLYKKREKDDSADAGGAVDTVSPSSAEEVARPSEKEREQAAVNAVNKSPYYMSKYKLAEYEAEHVAQGMRNASKKGLVLGISFFLLLVAAVALATVFAIKGIWVGAIICGALFVVSIVTCLIVFAVRERMALRGDISKAQKMICGKVQSCVASGMKTLKINRATRIKSVVYNVVVQADNERYESFSRRFYETDENVVIAVMGKTCKIVEEADLEKQSDEIKNKYNECMATGETVIITR